jgi:Domain of unknown function (DUF5664)
MNAPNPKKAFGDKKPALHLVPLSGMIAQWEAHFDGALKYTEVNWRRDPVETMTYIDAILRHTRLYENGEELARDTKVKNLGAVMACCAILIDAELHGTLIDNRTPSPQTCDLLHGRGEDMVKHLRAAQAERDAAKEQARIDQSWADAAVAISMAADAEDWVMNSPTYRRTLLYRDAVARQQGKNLDGSPRRETFMIDDAGGDAPSTEEAIALTTCGRCSNLIACQHKGYCLGH